MKKHLPLLLILVVFVVGLGVLLYPVISDLVNARSQTRAVAGYTDAVTQLAQEDYEELFEQARRYNEGIAARQSGTTDEEVLSVDYEAILRVGTSDVIGYVEIPRIDVRLPVYHGTSHAVLQKGVGHLEHTSLPVGGADTHAALSGHRGLPSSKLLTNLDQMELGDTFSIHILNTLFTYQVDQIEVVEPHEVDSLRVLSGGDLVTLITCTPYGVNTHRLLVRGTRVENPAAEEITVTEIHIPLDPFIPASIAAACISASLAMIFLGRLKRRRRIPAGRCIMPFRETASAHHP